MKGINKKIIYVEILILSFSLCFSYFIQEGNDPSKTITNFTFGSNYYGRYTVEENIFEKVLKHNSDLWIWLGNAVYLDEPQFNLFSSSPKYMDLKFYRKVYQKVKSNEFYSELEENIPIIGTWGDHEYGMNNGNVNNTFKNGYKLLYLDFLGADSVEQRRGNTNNNIGLYSTYSFGKGRKTIRIILLDLKYYKTPFLQNENADMLGDEQWTWLENIFKKKNETYTFIGTSNPILSNDRYIVQKWYQESRKKIFDLIGKYKKNGVIFLSGGLGFSQILKSFCPLPEIGYNLYEITSSGLGYSSKFNSFISNIYHNDYLIPKQNFDEMNFGQVTIDWGEGNISNSHVNLQIFNKDDELKLNVQINYTELIYKDTKDFYNDEKNIEKIKYMNIKDGKACEREIYHRVRTPLMSLRYYFTHILELPIALFTAAILIIFTELLLHKRFGYLFFISISLIAIYVVVYQTDSLYYKVFKSKIEKA